MLRAALLLVAWSLIKHSAESKRIALTALVLVGLSAIPAFLTGEPSERHLKGLPGISSRWMSNHEDMAVIALWAAVARLSVQAMVSSSLTILG